MSLISQARLASIGKTSTSPGLTSVIEITLKRLSSIRNWMVSLKGVFYKALNFPVRFRDFEMNVNIISSWVMIGLELTIVLIYMLLNRATDTVYIGQTTGSLEERFKCHKDTASKRLATAFKDFGPDVFEGIVLEYVSSVEEANLAETRWKAECDSTNPNVGYNVHKTAKRNNSYVTPEFREKCRLNGLKGAAHGYKASPRKTKAA